jgi:hypothetical protein
LETKIVDLEGKKSKLEEKVKNSLLYLLINQRIELLNKKDSLEKKIKER